MKRERRGNVRDYSKYEDELSMEHNGLFVKKGKLRIDVKRVMKLDNLFEGLIKSINKIPRNTEYFFPKHKKRNEYRCNVFYDHLDSVGSMWEREFRYVIRAVKTPKEAGDDSYLYDISFGILDPDECNIVRNVEIMKRSIVYDHVIMTIHAQFILYIGSVVEKMQIDVMTNEGHTMEFSGKKEMNRVLKEYGAKLDKIPNYDGYRRFYALWNFMKHSSVKSYDELKSSFPEILVKTPFKNGDYSLKYLKLNDRTIPQLLSDLGYFFSSFCEVVFKEDPDEARWNYDDYFITQYNYWREGIENPLGLSKWL